MSDVLYSTIREIAEAAAEELAAQGIPAEVNAVSRENGQQFVGISVGEGNVRPFVYVSNRDSVKSAVRRAADVMGKARNLAVLECACTRDYLQAKDDLSLYVLNYGRNKEFLEENYLVYRRFLDLAVGVKLRLGKLDEGAPGECTASTKVSSWLCDFWGVPEDDIFNAAFENLRKDMTFGSTEELMKEAFKRESLKAFGFAPSDEELDSMFAVPEGVPRMYYMREKSGVDGAAFLADTASLQKAQDRLGAEGIYILPSSRNEILIIPWSEELSPFQLQEMVSEVNRTELAESEFLSDSVYLFKNGQVRIIA